MWEGTGDSGGVSATDPDAADWRGWWADGAEWRGWWEGADGKRYWVDPCGRPKGVESSGEAVAPAKEDGKSGASGMPAGLPKIPVFRNASLLVAQWVSGRTRKPHTLVLEYWHSQRLMACHVEVPLGFQGPLPDGCEWATCDNCKHFTVLVERSQRAVSVKRSTRAVCVEIMSGGTENR